MILYRDIIGIACTPVTSHTGNINFLFDRYISDLSRKWPNASAAKLASPRIDRNVKLSFLSAYFEGDIRDLSSFATARRDANLFCIVGARRFGRKLMTGR